MKNPLMINITDFVESIFIKYIIDLLIFFYIQYNIYTFLKYIIINILLIEYKVKFI